MKQTPIDGFVFDENVARVFEDMIERSVPGYSAIINMIGVLAREYVQDGSVCYDLGCSLGASTLSMLRNIQISNARIIAVDNSQAMIDQCRRNFKDAAGQIRTDFICDDIQNVEMSDASVVVLNFTLQFITPGKREALLKKVYDAMRPGGIFIISDKIAFDDPKEQSLQSELHHAFKKLNGYSDLEIAQKRTALENVLVPDTLTTHLLRLQSIGFQNAHVWFQCFNFASMIAFKK